MVDPRIVEVMKAYEILDDLVKREDFKTLDYFLQRRIGEALKLLGETPAPELNEDGSLA